MSEEEIKEMYNYFRLSSYRDGEYFLLEEYLELEEIIRKNDTARYLEDERYKYLRGIITEEEYNNICLDCFNKLRLTK